MTADEKYKLSSYKDISLLLEDESKRIYLVKDEVTDRLYIKKIFHSIDSFDFYKRLAELRHKNLTVIHDVIKGDNEIYIIEDYVNGQTLKALLERNAKMPESEAIGYILQVCDALIYLHSQNPPIIHRDIKPENIICSTDNIIKLIDFDIAREYKKNANRDTRFMGTRDYAAPEQYGYRQTDCRTDIFSVGILIHELLTGRVPESNSTYNGVLKNIINKCLEIDPEKRFQSVSELKKALETRHFFYKKSIVILTVISFLFLGCWLIYMTNNMDKQEPAKSGSDLVSAAPPSPMPAETYPEQVKTDKKVLYGGIDLNITYDLFVKIAAYEEKPSILLENDEINKIVRSITGDSYSSVVKAFEKYTEKNPYPAYYDPNTNYFYVPACNMKDGYMHDRILFEMDREFLSITYFDHDLETTYYFTTNKDNGVLTPDAFHLIKKYHTMYENPVVFSQPPLDKHDIMGVYYFGNTKKIEIFESEGEMKFSYTDIRRSREEKPLINKTINKIDNSHYWIHNTTSGNKNRLIFNFSKNHLTLFTELYEEMIYLDGIYSKE